MDLLDSDLPAPAIEVSTTLTEASTQSLAELGRNQVARVVAIDPSASPRLAALGFCPGTMLRADRRAPLGDPMIFEVRGTRLALRQRDARCIRVSLV